MSKKYDVIVIGAGNGGLVAAAKCAHAGKKTLLVERHNLPGGSATSFVRGRFEFEASLHELCGIGPFTEGGRELKKIFDELGVSEKIEWTALDEAFRMITINDEKNVDYTLPTTRKAFIDRVEEYSPGSREKCEKLFDIIEEANAGLDYLGTIQNFSTDIFKKIFGTYSDFINSAGYTVNEVFDALDLPQAARDCFGGYWLYLGTPLDEESFMHYFTMFKSYIIDGPVIPKTRSHGISTAILERFEELGGEAWMNTAVKKIIVKNGIARGVELDSGELIECDCVISNASPYNMYTKLIDSADIPKYQLKKLNSVKLAPKGFSMFLGLDKSAEELGIDNHSYFIYDTTDTAKQSQLTRSRAANNMQAAVCLNKGVPGCSPEGTCILYITSLFTGDDAWNDITEENYVSAKREFADRAIANFEKATGTRVRDSIEEIEIATPVTYARYLDAPNGTIYGFENTGSYGIVQRVATDALGKKIGRLYYGGGYGTKSLGFSPSYTTGYEAAVAALKNLEKEAAKQ